jgi:hypothetical protein
VHLAKIFPLELKTSTTPSRFFCGFAELGRVPGLWLTGFQMSGPQIGRPCRQAVLGLQQFPKALSAPGTRKYDARRCKQLERQEVSFILYTDDLVARYAIRVSFQKMSARPKLNALKYPGESFKRGSWPFPVQYGKDRVSKACNGGFALPRIVLQEVRDLVADCYAHVGRRQRTVNEDQTMALVGDQTAAQWAGLN